MFGSHNFRKLFLVTVLMSSLAAPALAQWTDRDGDGYYYYQPHFRWGISGAGGGFAGPVTGLYGGLQVRLGAQLTEGFAMYYMGQALVGSFIPSSAGASLVGIALNSLMFEGRVGRHFQFAGGPSLDFLWGCDGTPVNGACGSTPVYFGLDGRVGLHFHPLTISFDVHPMFFRPDAVDVLLILGIGVDFD